MSIRENAFKVMTVNCVAQDQINLTDEQMLKNVFCNMPHPVHLCKEVGSSHIEQLL